MRVDRFDRLGGAGNERRRRIAAVQVDAVAHFLGLVRTSERLGDLDQHAGQQLEFRPLGPGECLGLGNAKRLQPHRLAKRLLHLAGAVRPHGAVDLLAVAQVGHRLDAQEIVAAAQQRRQFVILSHHVHLGRLVEADHQHGEHTLLAGPHRPLPKRLFYGQRSAAVGRPGDRALCRRARSRVPALDVESVAVDPAGGLNRRGANAQVAGETKQASLGRFGAPAADVFLGELPGPFYGQMIYAVGEDDGLPAWTALRTVALP